MFIASCSHNAPTDEFTAAVVRGVSDANRNGAIIRTAGAGADHPDRFIERHGEKLDLLTGLRGGGCLLKIVGREDVHFLGQDSR